MTLAGCSWNMALSSGHVFTKQKQTVMGISIKNYKKGKIKGEIDLYQDMKPLRKVEKKTAPSAPLPLSTPTF